MKLCKSDKIWKNYCRIIQARDDTISINGDEWARLNSIAWRLIEKYVEAIMKEFLK